ncbi:hypothetical protein [Caballeronia grimmiae]|uniref:hypothetical protein n=1 Tax=Caballeronia grimmiae TaxID=1071679 RepID=UPI001268B1C3|nr:hypothetical protein [Caballeronia grimmiae]
MAAWSASSLSYDRIVAQQRVKIVRRPARSDRFRNMLTKSLSFASSFSRSTAAVSSILGLGEPAVSLLAHQPAADADRAANGLANRSRPVLNG